MQLDSFHHEPPTNRIVAGGTVTGRRAWWPQWVPGTPKATDGLTVLLVSEEAMFRDALLEMLQAETAVGELASANCVYEAAEFNENWAPDVIVLDMFTTRASQVLNYFTGHRCSARLVLLAATPCEAAMLENLCTTSAACGLRYASVESLRRMFYRVLTSDAGTTLGTCHAADVGLPAFGVAALTRRERKIASLLWLSNKEIARREKRSVKTVKNQVHCVLQKIGASSRTEAYEILSEQGAFNDQLSIDPPTPRQGQR